MFKYNYDAKEFGNRIRIIRKKNKMTQEQLAEMLFLSVDSISKIENGKVMCMPEHVVKICQIYEVSTDYLFFGGKSCSFISLENSDSKILHALSKCSEVQKRKILKVIEILLE